MRLLDISARKLVDFRHGEEPRYAILSHCWLYPVAREVSYDDFQYSRPFEEKDGYKKIQFACARAKMDGLSYVWIDCCCINKADPLEVGKAINSMYRWYEESVVCYVYLEDVAAPIEELSRNAFSQSRWFTRGWTLQELIAPRVVQFFTSSGNVLGTRDDLAIAISRVTDINSAILRYTAESRRAVIETFSVAQRFAWASSRRTTEPEDIAYCLVGVFGVYLAPNYGEGQSSAFMRLQREIMSKSSDETVFAWIGDYDGLLAPSPAAYRNSQNIIALPQSIRLPGGYLDFISGGVRISAILFKIGEVNITSDHVIGATHIMALACRYDDDQSHIPGLLLASAHMENLSGDPVFYSVGCSKRIHRLKVIQQSKRHERVIFILTDPPPRPDGVILMAHTSNDGKPVGVIDTEPERCWQVVTHGDEGLVYHFTHSNLFKTCIIGGVRLLFDREYAVDVIFESDRTKRAFRLLALERAQENKTISDACLLRDKNWLDNRNDWIPWKSVYTEPSFRAGKSERMIILSYRASHAIGAYDDTGYLEVTNTWKAQKGTKAFFQNASTGLTSLLAKRTKRMLL